MTRKRLVQFWTLQGNHDYQRLDSEILYLRERVWERAAREVKHHDRKSMILTTGKLLLTLAGCIAYIWILGR